MNINKCATAIFLFILIFVLSGCSSELSKMPVISTAKDFDKIESSSTALDIDVYWDGTVSMQGYANPQGYTPYRQLPDVLENTVATTWPGSKVSFHKFGRDVVKLDGRDHRAIGGSSFYTETVTLINSVVDYANPGNLSIIVSDLFESDADWVNVASKIRDKYLAKNSAVAVVGLRSPFEGRIFDVGTSGQGAFDFSSGNDKAKYRPFYMIIMGRHADVELALNKLTQEKSIGQIEIVTFSSRLARYTPTLEDAVIGTEENLSARERLIQRGKIEKQVREYTAKTQKPIVLEADMKYIPTPWIIPFDVGKTGYAVSIKQIKDGKLTAFNSSDKDVIASSKMVDNAIRTKLAINPTAFPDKGWYFVEVSLLPPPSAFALPRWVDEWDMNVTQLEGGRITPENFNGATTINLFQLLNALKNATIETQKPTVGRMMLVLEIR